MLLLLAITNQTKVFYCKCNFNHCIEKIDNQTLEMGGERCLKDLLVEKEGGKGIANS